jgi:hypothetical protein
MRQAVYWLQYDANETYEQEGHIKVNTNLSQTIIATYVCRPPPPVPSQRMLSDIVHDSKLIYRIHALFVWILRTTNSAINESLFDALPTEEQTTKQERKGKIQFSKNLVNGFFFSLDVFENEPIVKHRSRTIIEILPPTLTDSNRSYLSSSIENSNHYENGFDDEDDYDSLEYQFSSYGYEALTLFKQFILKLNNINHLQYILSNWMIGNQLIIKYSNRIENKNSIRAFASVFRVREERRIIQIKNSIFSLYIVVLT